MKKLFLIIIVLSMLVFSIGCSTSEEKYNEQGYLITKLTDQVLLVETNDYGYEKFYRALFEIDDNYAIRDIDVIHNSAGQFYKAFVIVGNK